MTRLLSALFLSLLIVLSAIPLHAASPDLSGVVAISTSPSKFPATQEGGAGAAMPGFSREDAFALSDAFSLDGVAGYIDGRARERLSAALSEEGTGWLCDAFADAVNRARQREGSFDLSAVFAQDAALKAQVQEELARRIKAWLPDQMRNIIREDLLGGIAGEEGAAEVEAIVQRIGQELDQSLNDRIDAFAGNLYDSTLARLREQVQERGGMGWLDPTDIRGSLAQVLDVQTVGAYFAQGLSGIVGEGTVQGIRGRIEDALGGTLPPEAIEALKAGPEAFARYAEEAQQYLPGVNLSKLTDSLMTRPVLKLPTPAYASILAGSAAAHFARAFSGPFVDAYELKRGAEITKFMVWQVRNKEAINLSIMQLGLLARDLATSIGMGAEFEGLLKELRQPLDRLQGYADRIDALLMKPIAEVQGELERLKGMLQSELTAFQEALIGPLRDELENFRGWAQDELDRVRAAMEDALPEGFNGLPADWDELKRKAGIEGGVLGEAGDWKPSDELAGIQRKVREDLSELNARVSELIAQGAAEALQGLRLLGPAAEILDIERVPAQNVSNESALDPVLLHNGEYVQDVTDLVIPGTGIDIRFSRHYRGNALFLGELGWRWTHVYAERLLPQEGDGAGNLTYVDAQGRKFLFRAQGELFESPPGLSLSLFAREDRYELWQRDGTVTRFGKHGLPLAKCDRYENCIRYRYDDKGQLATVLDVFGRPITFERRDDGLIAAIVDFAGRRITFSYNDHQELIAVTSPATVGFPKGKMTAYRYAAASEGEPRTHRITMVMDPKGRVFLRNRYDETGRVVAQRYGEASWMTVRYGSDDEGVQRYTWVTDAAQQVRLYEHDRDGHLLREWRYGDGAYQLLASFAYDAAGNRLQRCLPSGRCTIVQYGAGVSEGLPVAVSERSPDGRLTRTTRMGRESRFGRIARIEMPSGVQERVEYAADRLANPIRRLRRHSDDEPWAVIGRYAFNAHGQLTWEQDARGVVTRYEYAPVSDPDGDGIRIQGMTANRSEAGSEGDEGGGYCLRVVRDASAHPKRQAAGEPLRQTTSLAYDAMGNVTAVTKPDVTTTKYLVNALNQVLREERPGFLPVRYAFDANDNLVRMEVERPGAPIVQEMTYDALDRLATRTVQVASGKHLTFRFESDALGRPERLILPEGNAIAYEYDAAGRLACIVRGTGSLSRARECVERDVDGLITAHIDGSGVRTQYVRDGLGEVIARIDALGNRIEFERDPAGRVIAVRHRDEEGKLLAEEHSAYAGDERMQIDRRLWVDDAEKSRWITERRAYDSAGMLIAITDASGATTRIERDGLGQEVARILPNGVRHEIERDALGRVLQTSIVSEETSLPGERFTYDAAGRLTAFGSATEGMWSFAYDGMGNLIRQQDPTGQLTRFQVDDAGRRISILQGSQGEIATRMTWDGNGRLTRVADAEDRVTRFGYDELDRLILERFADGSERTTSYDGAGRVTGMLREDGSRLSVRYDAAGNIAERHAVRMEKGVPLEGWQRFAFDGMGRLIMARDEGGSEDPSDDRLSRFRYDSLSRPVAEWQGGRWIARSFDDAGHVMSLALPDEEQLGFAHGPLGLLRLVTGRGRELLRIERDARGGIVRADMAGGLRLELDRDQDGRAVAKRFTAPGGEELAAFRWQVDAAGRVLKEEETLTQRRLAFERDDLGRLIAMREAALSDQGAVQEVRDRYAYDAVGNLRYAWKPDATFEMHYDERHRLIEMTRQMAQSKGDEENRALISDEGGHLLSDGERSYRFDPFGRLVQVEQDDEELLRIAYDAFDRPIAYVTPHGEEGLLWEGWKLMAKKRAGALPQIFLGAEGWQAPLLIFQQDGVHLPITDRLQSWRGVLSKTGEITQRCDYTPYGASANCAAESAPFGFAGGLNQLQGQLLLMRYRHYHPGFGRFLSPDPLGFKLSKQAHGPKLPLPGLSYHRGQGEASSTTLPNRPLQYSLQLGAYPFDRFVVPQSASVLPSALPEMNPFLYAKGDPASFLDPLGLSSLLFDHHEDEMRVMTHDGIQVASFHAANRVTIPDASPFEIGGNGPFPKGTYELGLPEFYSEAYRQEVYERQRLGSVLPNESIITGPRWSNSNGTRSISQGSVRMRAGASTGGDTGTVWTRQLFIHGGRSSYLSRTLGCIRMNDGEIERMAAIAIQLARDGDPLTSITVR